MNKLITATTILVLATGYNVVLAKVQNIPVPKHTRSHVASHIAPVAKAVGNPLLSGKVYSGSASFYADYFQGRKTASGEVFDQRKLTAASATLPFGTVLYVTNAVTGRAVLVRINDRMPVSDVTLDLSKSAYKQLGNFRDGVLGVHIVEVTLEPKQVR